MSDEYTEFRMKWLDAIASDRRVAGLGLAIAVKYATTYINRKSGLIWPSQQTLATDLKTTPRAVRRGVTLLIKYGYVEQVSEGHGRSQSNRYRAVLENRTYPSAIQSNLQKVMRTPTSCNADVHDQESGRERPKTPLMTPLRDSSDDRGISSDGLANAIRAAGFDPTSVFDAVDKLTLSGARRIYGRGLDDDARLSAVRTIIEEFKTRETARSQERSAAV